MQAQDNEDIDPVLFQYRTSAKDICARTSYYIWLKLFLLARLNIMADFDVMSYIETPPSPEIM